MTSPRPVPIFDGHNDVLLRLYRRGGTDVSRAFLEGEAKGQLEIFGPVLVVERRIDAAHAQVSETIQPWMRDLRHRNAEPVLQPGRGFFARRSELAAPPGRAGYRRLRELEPGGWFKSVQPEHYLALYREILEHLDPVAIRYRLLAFGSRPVLLCYEHAIHSGAKWCHRHIGSSLDAQPPAPQCRACPPARSPQFRSLAHARHRSGAVLEALIGSSLARA